jgi:hypothetical protein
MLIFVQTQPVILTHHQILLNIVMVKPVQVMMTASLATAIRMEAKIYAHPYFVVTFQVSIVMELLVLLVLNASLVTATLTTELISVLQNNVM